MKIEKLALMFMLLSWGWVWDFFNHSGQFMRTGRVKVVLLTSVILLTVKIYREWNWSVALFYLYAGGLFVYLGMPSSGILEMVLITASLIIIPQISIKISRDFFEWSIMITAIIHCVFGALNTQGIYPILPRNNVYYQDVGYMVMGLLGQHTLLAPYLVFAFSIALNRYLETMAKGFAYLAVLFLATVILCNSTMGYVSLAAALGVFSFFYLGNKKTIALMVIGLFTGIVAIYLKPELGAFSGRLEPWRDAWTLIQQRPLVGWGTGSWSVISENIAKMRGYKNPWTQLHHDYLQGILEFGVIGMSLIMITIFTAVSRAVRAKGWMMNNTAIPYIAGFATFSVNAMGNFTMHITPLGQLGLFCAYIMLTLKKPMVQSMVEVLPEESPSH